MLNWTGAIAGLYMASQALYPPDTPLKERHRILADFFDPSPGKLLRVTDKAIARENRDPLLVKGELWIRPPTGKCLLIRTNQERRDIRICTKTLWEWDLFDLDGVGRLQLKVMSDDPKDEGTVVSWPTPYRVANYIALGEGKNQLDNSHNAPIKSCQAETVFDQRRITLELIDGRRWFILLPEYDNPVLPPSDEGPPNLIVKEDRSKKDEIPMPTNLITKTEPFEPVEAETKPAPEKPRRKSVLGQLLSGEYKNVKEQQAEFRLPRRGAYDMSSSGFTETGSPHGLLGKCRYLFSGAPGDPGSGAIECYETDTFDSIYTHVTCFNEFKPRLNPSPPPKPSEGGP